MLWIFFTGVIIIIASMLGAYFLGSNKLSKAAKVPYESGIINTGSARARFPVHFYMIGVLFVIFDLESIFVYAYSANVVELGWRGFIQISIFISVLLLTLVYLLRVGALDIGPRLRKAGESE